MEQMRQNVFADAEHPDLERQLRYLADASAALSASLDYATTLERVARLLVPQLADYCMVHVVDDDGQYQQLAAIHSVAEKQELLDRLSDIYRLSVNNPRSPVVRVLQSGEPLLVTEASLAVGEAASDNPDALAVYRALNPTSYMILPLTARRQVHGTLTLALADSRRRYSRANLALAQEMASRCALAIDNARLYRAAQRAEERSQRHVERLNLLAEASMAFAAAQPDLDAVLQAVVQQVAYRIGDSCSVNLLSDDRTHFITTAVGHRDPQALALIRQVLSAQPLEADQGVNGRVAQSGEALLLPQIDPVQLREATRADARVYLDEFGISSMVTVPLKARGHVIGTVQITRVTGGQPYIAEDLQFLQDMANQAALVIESARLYNEMQHQRETLRQSRDQLAIILQGVADGISVQGRDGRLVFVNEAAARTSGYPSIQAMLKAPADDFLKRFELLDEAGQPFDANRLPGRRALTRGQQSEVTLRFRERATGRERWSIVAATPVLDTHGRPELAVSIFRDISKQKRAELTQRFLARATLELTESLDYATTVDRIARLMVPDLADWCVVDMLQADGSIATVALAHADPQKVALGWELRRRYPLDPDAPHGTGHVLRTGRVELVPNVSDELLAAIGQDADHVRLLRSLGVCSTLAVPIFIGGRPEGVLALVSSRPEHFSPDDVALVEELTRRAATAIEHAQLYQTAQQAIAARDQFLSIASHELRTPLTALIGHIGLIQRRATQQAGLPENFSRSLAVISHQAKRLNRLVAALLDISRIQMGNLSIEAVPVDLGALAQQVIDELRLTLEQHLIEVHLPQAAVVVVGDEMRLQQMLLNLLENAVKYSPQGGRVTVRVESYEQQGSIAVSDEGIGIPEEDVPQLFTRFYRASNVDQHTISGMGLGLYVIREIVALHNGRIEISSAVGKGSTFTVFLPLAH
jgi:PAS domain S-box-containing protein